MARESRPGLGGRIPRDGGYRFARLPHRLHLGFDHIEHTAFRQRFGGGRGQGEECLGESPRCRPLSLFRVRDGLEQQRYQVTKLPRRTRRDHMALMITVCPLRQALALLCIRPIPRPQASVAGESSARVCSSVCARTGLNSTGTPEARTRCRRSGEVSPVTISN